MRLEEISCKVLSMSMRFWFWNLYRGILHWSHQYVSRI